METYDVRNAQPSDFSKFQVPHHKSFIYCRNFTTVEVSKNDEKNVKVWKWPNKSTVSESIFVLKTLLTSQ